VAGLFIHGAAEVATLAGGIRRGAGQAQIGILRDDPAVAVYEDRIVAAGRRADVERDLDDLGIPRAGLELVDARGGTVTPGLIDAHTHLLFAGTRQSEVELRQRGHGYLEILAAGGGILQTVRHTRAAADDELLDHGRRWLGEMLRHGVTTVEAKTGYGLDLETELRLLELCARLGEEGPIEIVPTFLGAHAVAPEFREREDGERAYMTHVVDEMLPRVAEQGIATSVDVFCERGVFEVEDTRRLLQRARELGLASRLHADQLTDSGAAELAAEVGALSADHLGAVSDAGMDALAAAAETARPVIATLLPLSSFYLAEKAYAPARALIDRGVPVAVGTDFNPGSSPSPNAQLALSFAVHRLRMTPAEALAAMTINGAAALDRGASHGSLEPGKHADVTIWEPESHSLLPYWLGADLVRTVIKRGRVVYERG
jgi:imidazolonepropionase